MVKGNIATGERSTITMNIRRWCTDGERKQLLGLLANEGQRALYDAHQKMPEVGRIRVHSESTLSWPLHYARQERHGDTLRIVLATDRPIDFWEAVERPRSWDYQFGIIELMVKDDGEANGFMALGVEMLRDKDKNALELKHYLSEPVRLSNIRRRK